MKKFAIILLSVCFSAFGMAQNLFEQGNAAYAEQNYREAALLYDSLLQSTPVAELYYNLGNACFKQGELGKSILNYERALRLQPNNKDVRHNLQFAQSRIIDNIEDNSRFFLSQWITALRNLLSRQTWMWISIVAFILCLAGIICYAFARILALRKTGFHTAWIALLLSIVSLLFANSLYHRDTERREAVIMREIVNAKSSPDKSGTDLFLLHEGTKVTIRSTVADWAEIHVGNNIGWIPLNTLERI